MAADQLSKAERQRLARSIVAHLEALPDQLTALEAAMDEFGEDFDLARFKKAFDFQQGPKAYNRVQAVERGVGRVQNFLTDLAVAGARLAELPVDPPKKDESKAKPSFGALRDAGVIDAGVSRKLETGQKARSRIEHDYLYISAGEIHRTAQIVHAAAEKFVGPFAAWIEPYLD